MSNFKVFLRSLLHAAYGGALTALAANATGPITAKGVGVSVGVGALTGIIHFLSAKG